MGQWRRFDERWPRLAATQIGDDNAIGTDRFKPTERIAKAEGIELADLGRSMLSPYICVWALFGVAIEGGLKPAPT